MLFLSGYRCFFYFLIAILLFIYFNSAPISYAYDDHEDLIISMSSVGGAGQSSDPEINGFFEECQTTEKLKDFFNCACLAEDYARVRKEMGPEAHPSAIKNRLGINCKDASGYRITAKEKCLNYTANLPKGKDPEAFCTCYTNRFAQKYEALEGRLTNRLKLSMLSRARLYCTDREAARRIYGEN